MGKHFVFVSTPARGHVTPAIEVMSELVRRGHRVTAVTGPAVAADIAAVGATVVEVPWSIEADAVGSAFDTSAFLSILREHLRVGREAFEAIVDGLVDESVTAVAYDAVSPVGIAVADRLGVPCMPWIASFATNEHFPVLELLPTDFRPDHPDLIAYAGELAAFAAAAGIGAPLLPFTQPDGVQTIVFVPAAFQIAAETYPSNVHFVGAALGSRRPLETAAVPADTVYFSLGTHFTGRPDLMELFIDAVGDTEWTVVISGRRPQGALPANVEIDEFVDQTTVLSRAAAFVTHGGMGSVLEAIAAHVPILGIPQVGEQRLNVRRAVELGVGRELDENTLTPETLRAEIAAITSDPAVPTALAALASLSDVDGSVLAADLIERARELWSV